MINKPPPPTDQTPVGNIFGWRVSLIGLVLIVALAALAAYRHYSLSVPVGFDDPLEQEGSKEYHQEKAARERAAQDSIRSKRQQ
ncbi:hypothetical protein GGR28_000352 [Lewinella aquimaris]|uniref:Uncharacterized protein n=1 Tax=Neolewinella aquimaris TaxID=1835722 RepID=A0A840DXP1_9BACT|nr:hypothetical protein [Neolewinella aquimaris]MBB4077751.1 hypothetical protein [Neolewinella aquimaris]